MIPLDEKRRELLDILLAIKGPVMAEPGCLACCIYEEQGEEGDILYVEQWRSLVDMERHIRGGSYTRILEAMELSSRFPEIRFHETGETWGLELVEKIRSSEQQIPAAPLHHRHTSSQGKEKGTP
jgi:quinol monooxygenase YgiN